MIQYLNKNRIPEIGVYDLVKNSIMFLDSIGSYGYCTSPHYYIFDLNEYVTELAADISETICRKISSLKKQVLKEKLKTKSETVPYSIIDDKENITLNFKLYLSVSNLNQEHETNVISYEEFESYDYENRILNYNFYVQSFVSAKEKIIIIGNNDKHYNAAKGIPGMFKIELFVRDGLYHMYYWYKYITNICLFSNSKEVNEIKSFDVRSLKYNIFSKYNKLISNELNITNKFIVAINSLSNAVENALNNSKGKNINLKYNLYSTDLPIHIVNLHFIYESEDREHLLKFSHYNQDYFSVSDEAKIYIKIRGNYIPDKIMNYVKSCLYYELLHIYEDCCISFFEKIYPDYKLQDPFYSLCYYFLKYKDKLDRKSLTFISAIFYIHPYTNENIVEHLDDEINTSLYCYFEHTDESVVDIADTNTMIKHIIDNVQGYKTMNLYHSLIEEIEDFSSDDIDKICNNLSEMTNGIEFTLKDFYDLKSFLMLNWHSFQRRFYVNFHNSLHKEIENLFNSINDNNNLLIEK